MKLFNLLNLAGLAERRFWLFSAAAFSFFAVINFSSWQEDLVNRFERPIEYRVRHWLRQDPTLDPRIKIYAFGDSTFNFVKETDLSLEEWGKVIEAFCLGGAKAVFFDKLFGTPRSDEEIASFVKRLSQYPDCIVVTGLFVTPNPINGRTPLNLDKPYYHMESATTLKADQKLYAYGPYELLNDAFNYIGHILYGEDNYIKSFIVMRESTVILPAPFYIAKQREFHGSNVVLDGKVVGVDGNNRILINIAHPDYYADNTFALSGIISRAREGKPLTKLPKDAVIVVLPAMYTANTDIVQSPYGIIPGGYIQASLINGALTGKWLKFIPGEKFIPLVFALAGMAGAFYLSNLFFWFSAAAATVIIIVSSLFAFSFLSLVFPWFFSVIGMVFCGVVVYSQKVRLSEMAMQILRKDMELGSSAQALYLPETWHGDVHQISYRSVFRPYGPMSGDWVQIFNLGEKTIIALGDVVGKGPSAALNTAVIASLWVQHKNKWQKTQQVDLDAFVVDLNTTIFGLFRGRQFTTLHLAAISPKGLELYNFGAPPWLAISADKKIRSLRHPTRNPIGLMGEDPKVTKLEYTLPADEILIGYSDGAIDGPGARRRLEAELKKQPGKLDFDTFDRLVQTACVEGRLPDDYTLLMLQRTIT